MKNYTLIVKLIRESDFINVIVNTLIAVFQNWHKIMREVANYYWSAFQILKKQHIAKSIALNYLP